MTITENVYAGTTTDGIKGLLFTYQFTNAVGNAAIEAVAPGAFPAWLGTIFADYTSSSTGTQAPNDIFWNTDGGVDFSGHKPWISGGQTSYLLYVQTDATLFCKLCGAISVQDNVNVNSSQKYLKFQLPRAACSNFCVGYPRMARVPPVLLST